MTRRRLLKTLFCSSVLMDLNLNPHRNGAAAQQAETPPAGGFELLTLGDFGTGDERQMAVGRAMVRYAAGLTRKPDALLLLGDNFYGAMPGGVKSPRWRTGFSSVYPGEHFPGPCWAILGNHDYHDTPGNEQVQLNYAASLDRKTRWTCPGKYYRVDFPKENPQVTLLMIDTNWQSINQSIHSDRPCWMSEEERKDQFAWLEQELASKRAAFTIVAGHHPLYSDGAHGDTPDLVKQLGPLFEKHGVHLYLCGHDHDLQHLELEGLRTSFVLSGGGGARLYEIEQARPGAVAKNVFGFTHLSLAGDTLTIRHIDANGNIVHAFTKSADYRWKILS